MIKSLVILYVLISITSVYSQTPEIQVLKKERETLSNEIKLKKILSTKKEEELSKVNNELKESQEKISSIYKKINDLHKAKVENKDLLLAIIDKEISEIKLIKPKSFSGNSIWEAKTYRSYLKCLKTVLNGISYKIEEDIHNCQSSTLLSRRESATKINNLLKPFSISEKSLRQSVDKERENQNKLYEKEQKLSKEKNEIKSFLKEKEKNLTIKDALIQEKEIQHQKAQLKQKYSSFFSCDHSTPTIDLEENPYHKDTQEKGPFYGIPQDHQDGIGSCFANAGKNFLVGLSGGKINASFLDIALQYRSENNKSIVDLEGGDSCLSLEVIKNNGYCPQVHSPIESGEKTGMTEGLFVSSTNLYNQAKVLEILKNYFLDRDSLETLNDTTSQKFISQTNKIIKKLTQNPDIQLPYPQMKNFPLSDVMVRNLYWEYKRKAEQQKDLNLVAQNDFLNDFKDAKNLFISDYSQALVQQKSPDNLQNIFKKNFSSFFNKYFLEERLSNDYYKAQLDNFFKTTDENLMKELKATTEFYKDILGQSTTEKEIYDFYNIDCYKNAPTLSSFTQSLQTLVNLIKKLGVDSSILFDDLGNFLPNKDILQLAIAPKCLNPQNRRKLDFDFSCKTKGRSSYKDEGEDEKSNAEMKDDILRSLLKGLPVGQAFAMVGGNHINTIVGHRFNPSTGKCEFKIRESQIGGSHWLDADGELEKVNRLVIIAREEK